MKNYQLCRNFFITKFQSKRVCHQFNFIQRCSLLCEKNLDKSRKDDRNRLQNSTEDQDYSTLKKKSLIYRMQNVYFTKLQHNFSCSVLCLVIYFLLVIVCYRFSALVSISNLSLQYTRICREKAISVMLRINVFKQHYKYSIRALLLTISLEEYTMKIFTFMVLTHCGQFQSLYYSSFKYVKVVLKWACSKY